MVDLLRMFDMVEKLETIQMFKAIYINRKESDMFSFLDDIRCVKNRISVRKQIIDTSGVMFLGIVLGIISKYLDCTASNNLPFIIEYLDVRNFLGRFAIWILLAVCISIYSVSPVRASVNVFVFFAGMVTSYYLYSKWIAGFFPKSYAMIWIGFTILSPLLAFICWYSKGSGKVALIISAGIIAVLFNMIFVYGWIYFSIRSLLEFIVLICAVVVVRRTTMRDTIMMIGIGLVLAFVLKIIIPFQYG